MSRSMRSPVSGLPLVLVSAAGLSLIGASPLPITAMASAPVTADPPAVIEHPDVNLDCGPEQRTQITPHSYSVAYSLHDVNSAVLIDFYVTHLEIFHTDIWTVEVSEGISSVRLLVDRGDNLVTYRHDMKVERNPLAEGRFTILLDGVIIDDHAEHPVHGEILGSFNC